MSSQTVSEVEGDAYLETEIPEAFEDLWTPARYKVYYGGRGGAKSWNIARALLIIGASKPIRVLCTREFQKSITDSVHALLKDQIESLGLSGFYDVQEKKITGSNGTTFGFAGLRHNVTEIKGYEGADIAWVEEAQVVSAKSWKILTPTIRSDNSEIWVSFNPELDDDETYKRFVKHPPKNSIVKKVGYQDNPWFPQVLRDEMEELKERDYDAYLTVWEGHCVTTLDGAIYANEYRKLKADERITTVPHMRGELVYTAWDLGWGDSTSIWCVQKNGVVPHVIDYVEGRQQIFADYITELKDKGYMLGTCFLPHDAEHKNLQTGKSIKEVAEGLGLDVQIVPNIAVADGIEAARKFIDSCLFDENNCADGLRCLSRYQYKLNEDTQSYSRKPLHNWASHGADAFRYLAVMSEYLSAGSQQPGALFDDLGVIG